MTVLTGTVVTPDGGLVTGTISFQLNAQRALLSGACGGPKLVGNQYPKVFKLVNGVIAGQGLDGALTGPYVIYGNDCLTPTGSFYDVTVIDSDNCMILRCPAYVSGASFDIGTIVPPAPVPVGASLSGDVIGPAQANTVIRFQGYPMTSTAPILGDFIGYDGSTWKPIPAGPLSLPVVDTTSIVYGSVDSTKQLRFEVDGFTTATTRVVTFQNADQVIARTSGTNVFTGTQTFNNTVALLGTSGPTVGVINLAGAPYLHAWGGGTNLFAGSNAGNFTGTGINATGLGADALSAFTTAQHATAVGSSAGLTATTANDLTAVGYNSAVNVTTGTSLTFLGSGAGLASATQRTNSTAIGKGATVDQDNTVVLGNSSVTEIWAGTAKGAQVFGQSGIFGSSNPAWLGPGAITLDGSSTNPTIYLENTAGTSYLQIQAGTSVVGSITHYLGASQRLGYNGDATGAYLELFDSAGASGVLLDARNGKITSLSARFTTGAVNGYVWTSDASGNGSWAAAAAGGITSLNALTGATQTFTNDTNVTVVSGGTAHVITWAGTLATARGGLGADVSAQTGIALNTAGVFSWLASSGTGNVARVTSPVIVTPTISSQSSAAGVTEAFAATAPAQITTAQAGAAITMTASAAIAGSSVNGAAAGGSLTFTAGAAARLVSGTARGGDINLVPGAGIGGGVQGQVIIPTGGGSSSPGLAFNGILTSGIGSNAGIMYGYAGGNVVFAWDSSRYFYIGPSIISGGTSELSNTANLSWVASNVWRTAGPGGTVPSWLQQTAARTRVTTAATSATTNFVNVTDLTVTLVAGRKYTGHVAFFCDNSTAVDGIAFDFEGGTATATSFEAAVTSNVQGAVLGNSISAALATDITFTAMNGTTRHGIIITFAMVCNAAGTLIPRVALSSATTGTATVRPNSYLWIEDMP